MPLAAVREISDRDLPRLLELYAGCAAEDLAEDQPIEPGEMAFWLTSRLHRGFNFGAEKDGLLVAHLVLIRVGDTAEMSVFVHPGSRRRGIGSELLRVAIDQARDMGLRHIWVTVADANEALLQTLQEFGFRISRRFDNRTELVLSL